MSPMVGVSAGQQAKAIPRTISWPAQRETRMCTIGELVSQMALERKDTPMH